MAARANPMNWPLSVKVPLLVGGLMIFLGAMISNAVLVKMANAQKGHIQELGEAYLNGVSTAVLPHVLRGDVWEVYDVLDRSRAQFNSLPVKNTIVALRDNSVLAASDPVRFPVDSLIPKELDDLFVGRQSLVLDEVLGHAWVAQGLREHGRNVGYIYAELDILEPLLVRRTTLIALIGLTTMMTLMMAGLGYALVRKMLQPLTVLGEHVTQIADGEISDIAESQMPRQKGELRLLMTRFNTMARALRERETLSRRLAQEEKLAILGKLASSMAHEVNNPLGGMGNAIDTMRKHGDDRNVRERALDIIDRGLAGISNVTHATLATYKGGDKLVPLTHRDLEDVEFLVRHKIDLRRIELTWRNETPPALPVDGSATRQIALNLLLNACEASPKDGKLLFQARVAGRELSLLVQDEGDGVPDEVVAQLKGEQESILSTRRHGLGAWTVGTLLKRLGGNIEIETPGGKGTKITVLLPLYEEVGNDHAAA